MCFFGGGGERRKEKRDWLVCKKGCLWVLGLGVIGRPVVWGSIGGMRERHQPCVFVC